MAEAKIQKRNTYTIYDDEGIGTVQIADEVVAIIAGLAATEVDGVASMAGNITNELVSKLGMKNLSKGVKVDVLDGVVCVDLALNLSVHLSSFLLPCVGRRLCWGSGGVFLRNKHGGALPSILFSWL